MGGDQDDPGQCEQGKIGMTNLRASQWAIGGWNEGGIGIENGGAGERQLRPGGKGNRGRWCSMLERREIFRVYIGKRHTRCGLRPIPEAVRHTHSIHRGHALGVGRYRWPRVMPWAFGGTWLII